MKHNNILLSIMILTLIYDCILIIKKIKKKDDQIVETVKKEKIKKWENNLNLIVDLIVFGFFIFLLFSVKIFSYAYSFLYNLCWFFMYISVLTNILMKRENEKITEDELGSLVSIPTIFFLLYNTKISKTFFTYLSERYEKSIIYFILTNTIQYFSAIYFFTIVLFLILIEIKNRPVLKKKTQLKYLDFNASDYIYINARNKKGILFITGLLKDIGILVKKIILSIFEEKILAPIIYTFRVCYKFLNKLTKGFSIYIIIIKTFNISLIISLIIIYYKLLLNYSNNIIVDLYAVIITTIIIPIILNIIADLKNKDET